MSLVMIIGGIITITIILLMSSAASSFVFFKKMKESKQGLLDSESTDEVIITTGSPEHLPSCEQNISINGRVFKPGRCDNLLQSSIAQMGEIIKDDGIESVTFFENPNCDPEGYSTTVTGNIYNLEYQPKSVRPKCNCNVVDCE